MQIFIHLLYHGHLLVHRIHDMLHAILLSPLFRADICRRRRNQLLLAEAMHDVFEHVEIHLLFGEGGGNLICCAHRRLGIGL